MKQKRGPYFPGAELPDINGTSRFVTTIKGAGTAIAIKRYALCTLRSPVACRYVEKSV
jgi:hypothetical protein